jgi:hypothetical protein
MAIAADLITGLAQALALAGTDGVLGRAKDPDAAGVPVRFLLRHPSVRDEAIVNAYGVDAHIITIPCSIGELVDAPPEKFDFIDHAGGERYVFDAVLRRTVSGVAIAWTCYMKGKGV